MQKIRARFRSIVSSAGGRLRVDEFARVLGLRNPQSYRERSEQEMPKPKYPMSGRVGAFALSPGVSLLSQRRPSLRPPDTKSYSLMIIRWNPRSLLFSLLFVHSKSSTVYGTDGCS